MLRSDSVVDPANAVVSATIDLLDRLDFLLNALLMNPEQRHGREVDRRDQPVDAERVDDDEDDADERREKDVDRRTMSRSTSVRTF